MGVVLVAEGVQGAGEFHFDQIYVDADVFEGLGHRLGDFDGFGEAGEAALPDFQAEAVLSVVAGEAGLVKELLGQFRVVAIFCIKLFGPAGVPAFQGVVEDGVVHWLAAAFEQAIDDLLAVDGAV